MKDEIADRESASLDDFDLDSFLKENNFLNDEDQNTAGEDAKAASKQSRRSASSSRAASRRSASGEAGRDSLRADGEPRAESSESSPRVSGGSRVEDSPRADSGLRTDGGLRTDSDPQVGSGSRTGGASRRTGRDGTRSSATRVRETETVDLNATMSYEALGESYPEIPLIGDSATRERPSRRTAGSDALAGTGRRGTRSGSAVAADGEADGVAEAAGAGRRTTRDGASTSPTPRRARDASETAVTKRPARSRSATGTSAGSADVGAAGASTTRTRTGAGATRAGAAGAASTRTGAGTTRAAGATRTGASAGAGAGAKKRPARAGAADGGGRASQRAPRIGTLANPKDFHPAELADNTYHIRGGGTRHNTRSPLLVGLVAAVILVGIGLLVFFILGPLQGILGNKPEPATITLTSTETRSAIDSEMPNLIDNINYNVEEAYAVFTDAGWNVHLNDRLTSDNPDKSSTGGEIIHLAPSVDPAILEQGYYEGEFDAYDHDELQKSFNGAWMLDLSHGDSGAYAQIKYLNFAAFSLDDELTRLMALQGLDGETSVVDSRGQDDFDNTYVQGYAVVGGTTYYWKLIGIGFADYYRGQDRRDLPESAVFVKCTVATFDFYGAGEPETPEDGTEDGTEDAST